MIVGVCVTLLGYVFDDTDYIYYFFIAIFVLPFLSFFALVQIVLDWNKRKSWSFIISKIYLFFVIGFFIPIIILWTSGWILNKTLKFQAENYIELIEEYKDTAGVYPSKPETLFDSTFTKKMNYQVDSLGQSFEIQYMDKSRDLMIYKDGSWEKIVD